MDLAKLLGLSPEIINLIIFGLTLAVSIAHMRGNDLPILSALLRLLGGKPSPTPEPASAPKDEEALFRRFLDRLRRDVQAPGPPAVSP